MIAETIILFSTQDEALRYRKMLASTCDNALMGVTATTPDSLVEELWDVWGSRERIVSVAQRSMIVNRLLEQQDAWVRSAGTVSLLAGFLEEFITYLGPAFLEAHEAQFTPVDHEILDFVRNYEDALAETGLIEQAQAVRSMADKVHLGKVVVRTQQPLPAFMIDLLQTSAEEVAFEGSQLGGEGAMPKDRAYDLLVPKGQTAVAYTVEQAIVDQGEQGKILVTTPDPLALFQLVKDALVKEGLMVSVKAMRVFGSTLFGQTFKAVATLCDPTQSASLDQLLQSAATYIQSPYGQLMPTQRKRLMRTLRSDRTLTAFEICDALRTVSRSFEYFEALVEDSDADILFGFFEDLVHRMDIPAADQACELAILSRMKSLYREARKLQQQPRTFFDLVDALRVPYECAIEPKGLSASNAEDAALAPFADDVSPSTPRVLFTSLEDAASYPARCCDKVVMTSLDSEHYSGAARRSTLTEFLQRFGLPYEDRTLENMEQVFIRAACTANSQVVFEYAKQDLNGDEFYPAFFLETFLNESQNKAMKDHPEGMGEDRFDTAARMADADEVQVLLEAPTMRGQLTVEERAQLLIFVQDAEGNQRPLVSPSALELYRKCPYRWFVERKLHLEDGGEQFGPLEKGSFAHSVFQTFYDQWAAKGHDRVTPDNFEEAQRLFSNVFDQMVEAQEDAQPGNRYVAISELEREELAHLKRQLLDSLDIQQYLFPQYHVRGHEVVLSPEDKIVYAGAIIHGRVDRIDADDQGNCVVIDYKGSTLNHEAGFTVPDEDEAYVAPEKIQALMYAQALCRLDPALHPKAAVYLSYRAKGPKDALVGSILETLPESSDYSKKSSKVEGSFESFLDRVEESLVPTVQRMASGDIAPDPLSEHACDYCPVLYCEKRGNGSN